ncbi:putative diacyglycerol O-acyltransferase [Marmoricola endophyticus]|uniref:Diacylglycerol O-acyltransferase n=1 Tax=Marmoricola endophyticus TaxID=2040280 RepID=A0A917BFM4_9ACTN|nr:wax ester/triacylglycerol synthase family O-acyltransferase [Marmoricola endophyticus]GGF41356.1 putative diacyglycerol O-acyltransferase [Marmoricola endophyticus]
MLHNPLAGSLKLNDAAWLLADHYRTPMQVGVLATFTVPEDQPDFVAELVRSWREVRTFESPYDLRLRMAPVPHWVKVPAERIDLDYHLRHSALPSPGTQRELGVLISRLHSTPLDRRYPLWECTVIEGLEENRWSLYLKAHHSQIDGVGGVRLMRRILSVDPDQRDMLPPWAIGTHGRDQSGQEQHERPRSRSLEKARPRQSVLGGVRALAGTSTEVGGALVRTYAESLTGWASKERAVPFRAPRTLFNGRIQAPRRFATQTYEMDRLKAVAERTDSSLNDVFLALVGGAVRSYLEEHDALPHDPLIANVPVSVRPEDGRVQVGNAISFLYASLGTDVADPVERIAAVHASTARGKERLPDVGAGAMDLYTAALMAPFLAQAVLVGGVANPACNIVVSNVPGARETRYFNGSRLDEMYPISLLFHGQALNITAVSYDGTFNIGFTGCRDSVPSLQRIAVRTGEELEAMEAALGLDRTHDGPAAEASAG